MAAFIRALAILGAFVLAACAQSPTSTSGLPEFAVDPAWPQPLSEKSGVQQIFGQVAGIAVDPRNGHVWAIHRPKTLLADEVDEKTGAPVTHRCCTAAPAVVEFDA